MHYDTYEGEVRRRQADYRIRAERARLLLQARQSRRRTDWSLTAARLLHAAADRLEASAAPEGSSAGG